MQHLGQLIDIINNIKAGNEECPSKMGWEMFTMHRQQLSGVESRKVGESYAPLYIIKLLSWRLRKSANETKHGASRPTPKSS
jgi:hypothetical protein